MRTPEEPSSQTLGGTIAAAIVAFWGSILDGLTAAAASYQGTTLLPAGTVRRCLTGSDDDAAVADSRARLAEQRARDGKHN